ncbi:MAG: hypothetical protein MUE78_13075 [Ilumatobacteraceae bacterium]|nr:hypothetical protein [Ilumatobacteraceae bacterium]
MTITDDTNTVDTNTVDTEIHPEPTTVEVVGATGPATSARPRRRIPGGVAAGWIAVAVTVGAVGLLAYRFLADDPAPAPSPPASVSDAKDQAGYRSPTIQRELTSGDAKDRPTYRPALTAWEYTTGDAKDHATYRSPYLQRELTTGDPKDHATYRPALTSWEYTTGDAKDRAAP